MRNLFITGINIKKVRHLENINISISNDNEKKNLIITGRNGTGKTSLFEAIERCVIPIDLMGKTYKTNKSRIIKLESQEMKLNICHNKKLEKAMFSSVYNYNYDEYLVKVFPAKRNQQYEINANIKKNELFEGKYLHTYMVDLMTQSVYEKARGKDDSDTKKWFNNFEKLLQEIFQDQELKLEYDYKKYCFSIKQLGKEKFGFNELSGGYASIMDIVSEIMMEMEGVGRKVYDMPGIVVIDEIETHLHLELQKNILPFLTTTFPNIQFIVTTHSPFVITSDENATVFDLEHQKSMSKMTDYSYEGVVEGYFNVDKLSNQLKQDFARYKELLNKNNKTNEDVNEITTLEMRLDEVPDLLNLDFAAEYVELKFNKEFD